MHDAILETILCGMNEVNSSNIKQEIKKLSEVQAGGMTGFQEKFKVSIPVDVLCCFYQYLHCILWTNLYIYVAYDIILHQYMYRLDNERECFSRAEGPRGLLSMRGTIGVRAHISRGCGENFARLKRKLPDF